MTVANLSSSAAHMRGGHCGCQLGVYAGVIVFPGMVGWAWYVGWFTYRPVQVVMGW